MVFIIPTEMRCRMLYQNSEQFLSPEKFRNPPSCYRGAPFWSWNCYITKEMIDEQIAYFKEMGMGGFHVHVRVGLKNQYMDKDFLELVRYCVEKARENGMLCWLYDEDRYASGIAGGKVTKQIRFRARKMRLSRSVYPELMMPLKEFLRCQEEESDRYESILTAPLNKEGKGAAAEERCAENGSTENDSAENGRAENGSAENGSVENGSAENNSAENDSAEDGSVKNDSGKPSGCLLAAYDLTLENGYLADCRQIGPDEEARGMKWYLYEELDWESPWCNNQTYVDTLNPDAIRCFIQETHEKYAAVLGDAFGSTVPAIFTDEPNFKGMRLPDRADDCSDVLLAYTDRMPEKYRKVNGRDFLEEMPFFVWNRKGQDVSVERYRYRNLCCQMFVDAYCKTIGEWCSEHGIASTGHILGEESLGSQTSAVGEAMRCYREFQLPGMDNLCDFREFSAAKQVSSAVHQMGWEGAVSELYGVTQWDFNFEGYKLAGDWQMALGITTRVPHLAWASMEGEAKRDYPAAIGWQSPWYREFSCIEDHFARVSSCLTRGIPVVRVALLHPIESMWLYQGVAEQFGSRRDQLEEDFQNLTNWLLTGGIDFDYLSEDFLAEDDCYAENGELICGKMRYQVILIPEMETIRPSSLHLLQEMKKSGGRILVCGQAPRYVSCEPSQDANQFFDGCETVSLSRNRLLEALETQREIDIRHRNGARSDLYLHQIRQEGEERWVFLAQAKKGRESRSGNVWSRRALHEPEQLLIRLRGKWKLEHYDTISGEILALEPEFMENWTVLSWNMYGHDSLLLHLIPWKTEEAGGEIPECTETNRTNEYSSATAGSHGLGSDAGTWIGTPFGEPIAYETDEPNVLILDRFEYRTDWTEPADETGEQKLSQGDSIRRRNTSQELWKPSCELLRLDNLLRRQYGYPLRCESVEQPYVRKEADTREHKLWIRTTIDSEISCEGCRLALEEPQFYSGTLNGEAISMEPVGYYVDKGIKTVNLPPLKAGKNELLLEVSFGKGTNLEWMYLLGEFGVRLEGSRPYIVEKPKQLSWGDYTRQGFPFYTGNMKYVVQIPNAGSSLQVRVPYFSGAAVKLTAESCSKKALGDDAAIRNREEMGYQPESEKLVAFLPYECRFENLTPGKIRLTITCLGNRYNGFGQLHMIGDDVNWMGPDSWRTHGNSWTDQYQVKPMGVLTAPLVK